MSMKKAESFWVICAKCRTKTDATEWCEEIQQQKAKEIFDDLDKLLDDNDCISITMGKDVDYEKLKEKHLKNEQ